jgi:pimeloyl-ACP methyl ester carboxylesterase
MPLYEKGDVRIRYEEAGAGFPLLVMPGGGLNSHISNWATAPCNALEECTNEFRCITMDQRHANVANRADRSRLTNRGMPSRMTSSS